MKGDIVLEAENITRHYQVERGMFRKPAILRALDGATFTLAKSRTLAVVGESGCGKSTLARLVTMIEKPTSGELRIGGIDVTRADKATLMDLHKTVQIVFQDPYGSLNPRQKIGHALEEPLLVNTAMAKKERREAALDIISLVGLRPEHYDRYPHMFSGGQRQRIAVARALMLNPQIVVLDEPVSALDVSIQAQILNLIVRLQEQFELAYLFISHDLSVVKHIADEVMVMYLGKPVESGSRDNLFSTPHHPYTRALLSATPVADPFRVKERIVLRGELPSPIAPPSGCTFHPRCPSMTDICRQKPPEVCEIDGCMVACYHPKTY
ncbi:MAG: peptide ABC transporter ATP-binding protein [Desulfobulbaceae bacterium BRH_c16a]|nr:MAG: peptide ABC transporter ATP-binding protein [Desulfobulbaceae bacterium BRH_c16a]